MPVLTWLLLGTVLCSLLGMWLLFCCWRQRGRVLQWLDACPEAVLVVGRDGKIRYANHLACELSGGLSIDQLKGRPLADFIPHYGDGHGPVWEALFFAGESRAHGSLGIKTWLNQQQHSCEVHIQATSLPERKAVVFLLRPANQELFPHPQRYLAEKLLQTAEQDAGLGSWVLHTDSGKLDWSVTVHDIFGTDPDSFHPTEERYFACVHPQDRLRVRQELDHYMALGQPFDVEYRIVRPDGSIRHLLERNHVHYCDDGSIDYLFGTVIDMTKQKQLQEQLQLSQLAVEHCSEGIALSDDKLHWLSLNPALCQMLGQDDWPADQPLPLRQQQTLLTLFELQNLLVGESHWQGELTLAPPNRQPCAVWCSATRVVDKQQVVRWVWIFTDIRRIKEVEARLHNLAFHDTLTGLANRSLFNEQLRQAMQQACEQHKPLAIAFIDLNNFKKINDLLGHEAGDDVLCEVAHRLQQACRQQDMVCRWGGDEFALLLPQCELGPALDELLSRLQSSVALLRQYQGRLLPVTASMGVALYPDSAQTAEALMKRADEAMYRAKGESGRRIWIDDGRQLTTLTPTAYPLPQS